MCGCGAKNNGGSGNTQRGVFLNAPEEPVSPCDITKENLIAWKYLLTCIKENNYYSQANIVEFTVNKFLGIIQSALNYPSDYCYFNEQLSYFKTFILLNLLDNVPQCIHQ